MPSHTTRRSAVRACCVTCDVVAAEDVSPRPTTLADRAAAQEAFASMEAAARRVVRDDDPPDSPSA